MQRLFVREWASFSEGCHGFNTIRPADLLQHVHNIKSKNTKLYSATHLSFEIHTRAPPIFFKHACIVRHSVRHHTETRWARLGRDAKHSEDLGGARSLETWGGLGKGGLEIGEPRDRTKLENPNESRCGGFGAHWNLDGLSG